MKNLTEIKRINYDKLVGTERCFDKQIDWLDKLFKKHNVKKILDCGCGTGTHAVLLAKKGYDVTAFDYSKEQITLAKKKAKESKVRVKFITGDIRSFYFGKFDAVVSFYSPIMFGCKNKKELEKTIKCVDNSLNNQGIALLETMNSKMLTLPEIAIDQHHEKNIKLVRISFYDFNKKNKNAKLKYLYITNKNRKTTYLEAKGNHYYYDKKDFDKIINKTKLKTINWYSAFDYKKGKYTNYNEKTSGMIVPLLKKVT